MTLDPAELVCVTDETEPLFWIKKSQFDALIKGFTHVTGNPGERPIMQVISSQKIQPAPRAPSIAEIRKFLSSIQCTDCPPGREMNDQHCAKYGEEFENQDPCLMCKFDAATNYLRCP